MIRIINLTVALGLGLLVRWANYILVDVFLVRTRTPTLGNGVSITGFSAAVNALVRLNEADEM